MGKRLTTNDVSAQPTLIYSDSVSLSSILLPYLVPSYTYLSVESIASSYNSTLAQACYTHKFMITRYLSQITSAATRVTTSTATTTFRIPTRVFATMADSAPQVPTTAGAPWPEPQNWPAAKVRSTFIEYFQNQPGFEHTFWPSSGVIPFDDDTLLFANAVGRDLQ